MTKCLNCDAVLTDDLGHRLKSANFDSSLPSFPPTRSDWGPFETIWARCDGCYDMALARMEQEIVEQKHDAR